MIGGGSNGTDLGDGLRGPRDHERHGGLLLRGGHLVDARGARPEATDLLIRNGRIDTIGRDLEAPGAEVIEIDGPVGRAWSDERPRARLP